MKKICCISPKGDYKCCSTARSGLEGLTQDQEDGPTPNGTYLIGQKHKHPVLGIDWRNLYKRKIGKKNEYHPYGGPTETGRGGMGLHPGTLSKGCVSVDKECWCELNKMLEKGKHKHTDGTFYAGFLKVQD